MGTFDFTDLGALGAICFVLVGFAMIGFTRGVVRMVFGLLSLAAGGLAAYWGFQRGASLASYVVSDPDPWMAGAVGIVMGVAIFLVARAIFGILIQPGKVVDGKKKNHAGPGGFLGLVAGLVFVWFLISGIRYMGSLAEMKRVRDSLSDEAVAAPEEPLAVKVKALIDDTVPGRLHARLDFLNDEARCNLAKLQILVQSKAAIAMAARDPALRKTFTHAGIRKFLETSSELNGFIADGQFSQLLESRKLREVTANPEAREILTGADIEIALGITPPAEEAVADAKE